MAENSKIEWTDHTLRGGLRVSPKLGVVSEVVTPDAKRDAIPSVKSEIRVRGEVTDVMGVEVATSVVPAMGASETISSHHIVSPALQLSRVALPTPLDAIAVDVAGRIFATRRSLPRLSADLRACFDCVLFAYPVARPRLGRCAHLGAALFRHTLSLHRWNEGRDPLFPSLFNNFAAGHSHG
jgi:hypothetical protein